MKNILIQTVTLGMLISGIPALAADVALDIGHTLEEPGALSASGTTEITFNQRLAAEVAEQLQTAGISVHLINQNGKAPSLGNRTSQAAHDRLFVSLHHDSVKPRFRPVTDDRFQGFSLWVSEAAIDYPGSLRCARAMADRLLAGGFNPSHYHADPVYGENRPVVDWNRGIFSNRNLAVLKTARSAAVLFEAGVIAHPQEETRLADPETRRAIAAAITGGIKDCLKL